MALLDGSMKLYCVAIKPERISVSSEGYETKAIDLSSDSPDDMEHVYVIGLERLASTAPAK